MNPGSSKKLIVGISITISIVFVALLVYLYSNFTHPQQSDTLSTPDSTTEDTTDNWRTYEDKNFGFSFQYPAYFLIENLKDKIIVWKDPNKPESNYEGYNPGIAIQIILHSSPDLASVVGEVHGYQNIEISNSSETPESIFKAIKQKFGNNDYYFFESDGIGNNYNWIISSALRGSVIFYTKNSNGMENVLDRNLRQILSTFKFIDATDPSATHDADWKTYENKENGFSIQYPRDWKVNDSSHNTLVFVSPATANELQKSNNTWTSIGDFFIKIYPVKDLPNNTNTQKLDDWIISDAAKKYGISPNPTPIQVSGTGAYRVIDCGQMCIEEVFLEKNGTIYEFSPGNSADFQSIGNQILSTFKFL